MSGVFSIGTRSLTANQAALQTTGNNIANVNTPGYSRQSVVLKSVPGQFSGSGYYGNGVEVTTVQRNHSDFLTRQATVAGSVSASDTKRQEQLKQLEDIFQGGKAGLGASVSDMLNSFTDITSSPTDLTARSVVLTRVDEMAARFRSVAGRLDDLRQGVGSELKSSVAAVNGLGKRIADANEEIARAQGSGQAPNDLLDQRDQLITELNKYVQTTSIAADDGTVGIFLAGSQPLVLGTTVSSISITSDEFSDPAKSKLSMLRVGSSSLMEEATLGGGTISGLLRFQNSDLVEAGNLLGRLALAIGTAVNEQHHLGIDLSGIPGGDLFRLSPIPNGLASANNTGTATLQVGIQTVPTSGTASLAASNYEVTFNSGTSGNITRQSDGQISAFDLSVAPIKIDGLDITLTAGAAAAGDQFVITPFRDAASSMNASFSTPRALAMANPVAANAGINNQGTLAVASLKATAVPAPAAVTLTFTAPGTYTRSDVGGSFTYTPGQAIDSAPATVGWSLTLKGAARIGDTFTVQANAFPTLSAGNAEAMLALRDVAMFDGGALTDGYASAMSQIGVRVQAADFAAQVSTSIATNIEKDRASVAGVNLDEEAAKLLQYQQAYQSSAKLLQVAQSFFDTLLQTIGR